jgi:transcriptional regulator with PAS, ATPase and Fis domain
LTDLIIIDINDFVFDKNDIYMQIITTDAGSYKHLAQMLEGYDCPAILVSLNYQILATNQNYRKEFGEVSIQASPHCYEVSHGYSVPCDEAGEDCPLSAVLTSGHKERVLHIHQTPRGKEHVDVEMLPICNDNGEPQFFIELLKPVSITSVDNENSKLVGRSKQFNLMLEKITRVSRSDASVLLLGESGTGKELVAQAVHQASERESKSLVTLECAGLTDSLFESELFGHIKGSFTGANNNKTGLIELANGGTLFLDEIGDVPLSMQVKLLRLIETGAFRPVGSSTVKHTNFRLICATHKNLMKMVKDGSFRQDLFYRINVFPIYVPTLRDRQEDIPLLVTSLLSRISKKKEYYLTDSALQRLKNHPFPGNIRELSNILNRAIVLTDTNIIDCETIDDCLRIDNEQHDDSLFDAIETDNKEKIQLVDLKTAEKNYLSELMELFENDKDEVAKVAGISLRSLYRKLE